MPQHQTANGTTAPTVEKNPHPAWFRPWRLLLLFTYAMLLLWMDQGTFSSASVVVSMLASVSGDVEIPSPMRPPRARFRAISTLLANPESSCRSTSPISSERVHGTACLRKPRDPHRFTPCLY